MPIVPAAFLFGGTSRRMIQRGAQPLRIVRRWRPSQAVQHVRTADGNCSLILPATARKNVAVACGDRERLHHRVCARARNTFASSGLDRGGMSCYVGGRISWAGLAGVAGVLLATGALFRQELVLLYQRPAGHFPWPIIQRPAIRHGIEPTADLPYVASWTAICSALRESLHSRALGSVACNFICPGTPNPSALRRCLPTRGPSARSAHGHSLAGWQPLRRAALRC
jgi:hypothetical protein